MSELSDTELDRLLGLVKVADMQPGFTDRLVHSAWALPQRQSMLGNLHAWLNMDAMKWRMAGASAALLLAFSAGYLMAQGPLDEEDLTGIYAIDQSEYVEIL